MNLLGDLICFLKNSLLSEKALKGRKVSDFRGFAYYFWVSLTSSLKLKTKEIYLGKTVLMKKSS